VSVVTCADLDVDREEVGGISPWFFEEFDQVPWYLEQAQYTTQCPPGTERVGAWCEPPSSFSRALWPLGSAINCTLRPTGLSWVKHVAQRPGQSQGARPLYEFDLPGTIWHGAQRNLSCDSIDALRGIQKDVEERRAAFGQLEAPRLQINPFALQQHEPELIIHDTFGTEPPPNGEDPPETPSERATREISNEIAQTEIAAALGFFGIEGLGVVGGFGSIGFSP